MNVTQIPWRYRIASRQTVPILTGILGCLSLLVTLGYFYAREEVLNTINAQVKQLVSSISRQDDYTRQWLMRSLFHMAHIVEKHNTYENGNLSPQNTLNKQIISAISDARGKQTVKLIYRNAQQTWIRYYTTNGIIPAQAAKSMFPPPPSIKKLQQIDTAYWSSPFVDDTRTLHIRYSVPLRDEKEKTVGLITSSLSIPWLTERIRSLTLFKQCLPFFLTEKGQWTLDSDADVALIKLKEQMLENKTGISTVFWRNKRYIAVFMPSGEDSLLIGLLIPRKNIFGSLDSTAQMLVFISFIILLIASYALHVTNANFRKPLHQLFRMVNNLTQGKIDTSTLHMSFTPATNTQETQQLYKAIKRLHEALHQRVHDIAVMTQTRERLQGELDFARNIQNSLRPSTLPQHKNLAVAAFVHTSREVCGDMYDCFELSKKEICCVMGNVAEHGVPAALLTNRIMPLLHELMLSGFTPAKALEHVNKVFESDESTKTLYVSAFVGIVHKESGLFTWASAGQLLPYIFQNTPQSTLCFQLKNMHKLGNGPLGAKKHETYSEHKMHLTSGQNILFFPERLLNIPNPSGQRYDKERLYSFLTQEHDTAQNLLRALYGDILVHLQRVLRDDIVLFAMKWKG